MMVIHTGYLQVLFISDFIDELAVNIHHVFMFSCAMTFSTCNCHMTICSVLIGRTIHYNITVTLWCYFNIVTPRSSNGREISDHDKVIECLIIMKRYDYLLCYQALLERKCIANFCCWSVKSWSDAMMSLHRGLSNQGWPWYARGPHSTMRINLHTCDQIIISSWTHSSIDWDYIRYIYIQWWG